MSSVLIIEDDPRLARVVQTLLKKEKFVSDVCRNGEEGYKKALANIYNIILLDWALPSMDGEEILLNLRANRITTPILVLTARTNPEDAAKMINAGADDYIRKSLWNGKELIARIKNLLRNKTGKKTNAIEVGALEINLNDYIVTLKGKKLELDNMDFRILACLAAHSPDIVSAEDIIREVWGDYELSVNPGTVRAHLCYLRKQIATGKRGQYIHTVHGRGFRLYEEKDE
jgi:DNA-binding response OmpR family regulator